jgi:hypothetical protein
LVNFFESFGKQKKDPLLKQHARKELVHKNALDTLVNAVDKTSDPRTVIMSAHVFKDLVQGGVI